MTNYQSKSDSKQSAWEPKFKGSCKELEDHFFYYGKKMDQKCLSSSKKFIQYVGEKMGESAKQSILQNVLVIMEVSKPRVFMKKEEFEGIPYSEQMEWHQDNTIYSKQKVLVGSQLLKLYSVLWGLCTLSLQGKIECHEEFGKMNRGDVKDLYRIINLICHSSTTMSNVFMKAMEAHYNFHMIRGDDYCDLSLYLTDFEHRYEVFENAGGNFATEELRDKFMVELKERGDSKVLSILEEWKNPSTTEEHIIKSLVDQGKEVLVNRYKAYVYVKRAGTKYDEFRKGLINKWGDGDDKYPGTLVEAHRRLETYISLLPRADQRTSEEQQRGSNFVQDGEREKSGTSGGDGSPRNRVMKCFRCDREGHVTKECRANTKSDKSPLNSPDVIDGKYKELADAKALRRRNQPGTTDTVEEQHMTDSLVQVSEDPTFQELIEEEEDDAYSYGSNFMQKAKVVDLRGKDHIFNMSKKDHTTKLLEILCDNQSTCDVIVNKALVVNIRQSPVTLVLRTQAGQCRINLIADLPGVGTVWYYPEGVANIISQHRMVVNSGWDVKYSTDKFRLTGKTSDLKYECTTMEGIRVDFAPNEKGLHVFDCSPFIGEGKRGYVFGKDITDNKTMNGLEMCHNMTGVTDEAIDTVENSKKRFSARDQKKALSVRRFQHVAGHPSDGTLIYAAVTNSIKNNPFTKQDVSLTLDMLGKSQYSYQGKRVRRQPLAVTMNLVPVPPTILNYYKDIELSADVMHVNKIPILVGISKGIHYGSVRALQSMTIPVMETDIKAMMNTYSSRGFCIKVLHVDIQFKAIKDRNNLIGVRVNVVSRGEHVPEIERFIRVVKERARCYFAMLPVKKIPNIMVIHMIITVVFYINAFVWRQGVSQFLTPMTIVEGVLLDYNLHFSVIFGEYAQVYEGTYNNMRLRTVGAIALGPSGNLQGGVRFYSLLTGKILHRDKESFDILKMPHDSIKRLEYMSRSSPLGLIFGDRNNVTINDDIEADDNTGVSMDTDINGTHPYDIQVEEQVDEPSAQVPAQMENDAMLRIENADPEVEELPGVLPDVGLTGVAPEDTEDEVTPENAEDEVPIPNDDAANVNIDEEEHNEEGSVAENEPMLTTTRSGRISKAFDPATEYPGTANYTDTSEIQKIDKDEYQHYVEAMKWCDVEQGDIEGMMFAAKHMSIQKGIKDYKEAGKASAMKEILNLTGNNCFGETEYEKLTQEDKDKALPILMFMIMKRNGSLKSRGVANGSVQRLYTNKEDVSSPTPDFYSFKFIAAIIAKECRDAASVDLPGFFLQTDQEERILLKVTGAIALLLVESEPGKWKKHLRQENGKYVIYVLCKKAIYGTMNAALLAYKKLAKLFSEWGFKMNPYDPCVWNMTVDGKQFTIIFHIDDLMLSHLHANIVTMYINKLQEAYGKREDLTVTRGKVHEYLGMTVDFRVKYEVKFSQYDGIKKLLKSLPDSMNGMKNTAAPAYLFNTKDDSCLLENARKVEYHTITAKTLWFSQRSRPDLQLATGFHCTRIREPTEHDWKKLSHEMQYLRKTRFIPLIIGIGDDGNTVIHIDGAHAVHNDCKGHSGLYLTMGKGAMINVSKKLGLLTNSSTESEIVSTGERLPKTTWFRYFRIEQGEPIKEDILLQDNQSAIRLQKHHPFSVGKGSKHIHIRYFFAVDKISKKEVRIVYCPTEDMVADYSTKPLQGLKFIEFRNIIQGIIEEDFATYQKQYIATLRQYDLFEDGDDIF